MELRQFRYFIAIADGGSFSRAAQLLHVAQSALSKQMAELEAELETQLLLRSRTGVAMTEAGGVFYEHAQGVLKQVSDVRAAVHSAAHAVTGSVVVALPQSVSPLIALPIIEAAARRYPDVVLHLNEELTGNMADQLLRGRIDVAVFSPTLPKEDVAFTPVIEEDFVLLESPRCANPRPPGEVSLDEATERALVWPARTHGHCTRGLVEAALEADGRSPARVVAEINSVPTLRAAVEAGLGPTIMPLGLAQREVSEGRLVAHRLASPLMHRVLGLCVSAHLPASHAKRAIVALIGQVMRELAESGQWQGARAIRARPLPFPPSGSTRASSRLPSSRAASFRP